MRINDVAQYLGISKSNLDKMQAEKRLCPADYLIGKGKIRVWKFTTIQSWLNTLQNPKSINHKEATMQ